MIKVGLTGGIGSGKSMIARIFNSFLVPVYDSDYHAKSLYNTDESLKIELINHFGNEVFFKDGTLNRKYLSNLVFQDRNRLDKLNQLVHPRVKQDFENWLQCHIGYQYIIKEAAILIESGAYQQVDRIIVVSAPDNVRIERVIERDSVSRSSVLERMSNQLLQSELIKKADFVIINDGKKAILPQVFAIHHEIIDNIR